MFPPMELELFMIWSGIIYLAFWSVLTSILRLTNTTPLWFLSKCEAIKKMETNEQKPSKEVSFLHLKFTVWTYSENVVSKTISSERNHSSNVSIFIRFFWCNTLNCLLSNRVTSRSLKTKHKNRNFLKTATVREAGCIIRCQLHTSCHKTLVLDKLGKWA